MENSKGLNDTDYILPNPNKRCRRKNVSFTSENNKNLPTFDPSNIFEIGTIDSYQDAFKHYKADQATILTPQSAYFGLFSANAGRELPLFTGIDYNFDDDVNAWGGSISPFPYGDTNCFTNQYFSDYTGNFTDVPKVVEVEGTELVHKTAHDNNNRSSLTEEGTSVSGESFDHTPTRLAIEKEELSKWDVTPRYTLKRKLGHGSYGEVAEGSDNFNGGKKVAIKKITNVFDQELDAKRIYREMFILRTLGHTEIIRLLDVVAPKDYQTFEDLYLVFEYIDTDLYKLILSPQYLSDAHIKTFLYQMLVGLKHIHSAHVIHRDLKPANILLNEDCTLKICDFGLSRVVGQEHISRGCNCSQSTEKSEGSCDDEEGEENHENILFKHNKQCDLAHGCNPTEMHLPHTLGRDTSVFDDKVKSSRIPLEKMQLKRQLTKHVVTRWYRAPELILLQDYTSAVDVWSLGCIFAELLSMQSGSVPHYQDRMPLFPGKSCFPLSVDAPTSYTDKLDQLNVIFDVIGTPSEEDVRALGEVKKYLNKLPPQTPRALENMYKAANPDAIDLLQQMLQFNPSRRITVNQALEHKYLSSARRLEKEEITLAAIPLDVENIPLSKDSLKKAVYQEVLYYQNKSS
mmetsp:Transcript_13595/g.19199  ORF Transcript_13595/g.19199 Transcript_13595/m.19199 type:complete len:629 (-) Transcript_13595:119-2005(-)